MTAMTIPNFVFSALGLFVSSDIFKWLFLPLFLVAVVSIAVGVIKYVFSR